MPKHGAKSNIIAVDGDPVSRTRTIANSLLILQSIALCAPT